MVGDFVHPKGASRKVKIELVRAMPLDMPRHFRRVDWPAINVWMLVLILFSQTIGQAEEDRSGPIAKRLAARIDEDLEARLRVLKIKPSPPAGDAEFLRRIYLDLAGRIPTITEARAYFDAPEVDKRERLVDHLLNGPDYAWNFATFWRKVWLPQTEDPAFEGQATSFEAWLRYELAQGTSYDRMIVDQVTASFRPSASPRAGSPRSFLLAGQLRPETLAANTARAFLGLNLDCAQCHDHPFASWTRDDFWQLAAFFGPTPDGIRIEGTERVAPPRLLGGASVTWPRGENDWNGRFALASWIVREDNPYFARNAVNRLWAHFFGLGLKEPLDDLDTPDEMGDSLLDDLASGFAASRFDPKVPIRAIVLSQAYGRTSGGSFGDNQASDSLSRMPIRSLSGEQIYTSLRTAAGLSPRGPIEEKDGKFIALFRTGRPNLADRTVPQTLALFNGSLINELVHPDESPTVRMASEAPFLDGAGRIEMLFLATLTRPLNVEERENLTSQIATASAEEQARKLGNLFWALLNSQEFQTNH